MSIKDFRTRDEIIITVKGGKAAAGGPAPRRRGQAIPSKVGKRHLPRRDKPKPPGRYINFYDLGFITNGAGGWIPDNRPTFNLYTADYVGLDGAVRKFGNYALRTPLTQWKTRFRKIDVASTANYYRLLFTTFEAGIQTWTPPETIHELTPGNPNWTANGYRFDHPLWPEEYADDPEVRNYWTLDVVGGLDILNPAHPKKFYENGAWPGLGVPGDPSLNVSMFERAAGHFGFLLDGSEFPFLNARNEFALPGEVSQGLLVDDGSDIDIFLNNTGYYIAGDGFNQLFVVNRDVLDPSLVTTSTAVALGRWQTISGYSNIQQFAVGGFFGSYGAMNFAIHQNGRWCLVFGL